MVRIFGLAAVFMIWAEAAQAACSVTRWRFVWGTEGAIYMTSDGGPCRTSVTWTRGTTEVHSVSITSRPQNGTASMSGNTVHYRPKAGFKGQDSFVFTIDGRRHGAPERAPMRVNVTVK